MENQLNYIFIILRKSQKKDLAFQNDMLDLSMRLNFGWNDLSNACLCLLILLFIIGLTTFYLN